MNLAFPKPQKPDKDSPWRICRKNLRGCEGTFRIWRGSRTTCPKCYIALRKERQNGAHKRPGAYPKPKPQFWGRKHRKLQIEAVQARCEVCLITESACKVAYRCGLTRDHILPVRWITSRGLGNPHLDLNIKMTCSGCGGKKTAAEVKLFAGDVLGFVSDLLKWNWDAEELEMVLRHYNFFPQALEHLFRAAED